MKNIKILSLSLCSLLLASTYGCSENLEKKPAQVNPHAAAIMQDKSIFPHAGGMNLPAQNPHQSDTFVTGNKSDVSWKLPEGWTELAPTAMRLGNFLYTDKNGQKVEITVASLPGQAGGISANFNMWRSQLGLPTVSEDEVLKDSKKIKPANVEMSYTELVSTQDIIEGKFKAAILGAICSNKTNTWFFKMKGESQAVQNAKSDFEKFLESVSFTG